MISSAGRRRSMIASLAGSGLLLGVVSAAPALPNGADSLRSAANRPAEVSAKPRVFVLTDIGSDPDDEESLVRFLLYTDEFDVAGVAAVTSTWLRDAVHPELIEERVKAYGQVRPNLLKHAAGYPAAEYLLARVKSGPPVYGMEGVGAGKDSAASDLLIAAVDRPDSRPVWITDWGGANVLAQALWKVRVTRTPAQVDAFVARLRVYAISDQDDSSPWIRRNFPKLFWISSIHAFNQYYLATWTGISGENLFHLEVGAASTKISHQWLAENIRKGPLGTLYPDWKYIMEGDTPSFLYLIQNGLGAPEHPDYGSWGGRYGKVDAEGGLYADVSDKVTGVDGKPYMGNQATVWRWRDAFQNDFATRIQWTLTPVFKQANHNPVLIVNGIGGSAPVEITAPLGAQVNLDAAGSYDPDHDALEYRWWQYDEAGFEPFGPARPPPLQIQSGSSMRASFIMPPTPPRTNLHVILEVHDNGTPSLTSYRRIIVSAGVPTP